MSPKPSAKPKIWVCSLHTYTDKTHVQFLQDDAYLLAHTQRFLAIAGALPTSPPSYSVNSTPPQSATLTPPPPQNYSTGPPPPVSGVAGVPPSPGSATPSPPPAPYAPGAVSCLANDLLCRQIEAQRGMPYCNLSSITIHSLSPQSTLMLALP